MANLCEPTPQGILELDFVSFRKPNKRHYTALSASELDRLIFFLADPGLRAPAYKAAMAFDDACKAGRKGKVRRGVGTHGLERPYLRQIIHLRSVYESNTGGGAAKYEEIVVSTTPSP